jgi:sugar lactone lactonase YvrE
MATECSSFGGLAQGSLHFYDEKEKRFLPYLGGLPTTQLVFSPDRKRMRYTDYPRGYLWRCKIDGQREVATRRYFGTNGHVVAGQQVNRVYRLA